MRESNALIAIVDDDPSVREGLETLIRSAGWRVETFASTQEFLARRHIGVLRLRFVGQDGRFVPFYGGVATIDGGSTERSTNSRASRR